MMKNLIQFELRKIFGKRFVMISMVAVLLLSFVLSFSTLQNMYATDGKGVEGSGKAAVEIDKKLAAKYAGVLTDEKVQQMMTEFKPNHDLHGMNAQYLYMNTTQSAVFSRFSDMDGNWNGLRVSDVFGNEEIRIGYVAGWLYTSQNLAKVLIALSFALILMIAPVFSGEYGGVDAILLTTKLGKTKCISAKIAAGFIVSFSVTAVTLAFHFLFARIVYGTDGLDCSILFAHQDFIEGYIPFNMTCRTVIHYQVLLAFLSAAAVTGISLMLSALCKNQMIAFAGAAAIYILPILLPISETNPLYRIVVLMPLYYSQYISILSVEQMKNGMLYAVWAIPMALILAMLGTILSRKVFSHHQVC